ncbi:MAG: CAP domain-containing protein [Candidatus Dadabacteria bacterium]|nr:MAG: CAP domain-containing protein [Candidatus Dadabacteria bacterium]
MILVSKKSSYIPKRALLPALTFLTAVIFVGLTPHEALCTRRPVVKPAQSLSSGAVPLKLITRAKRRLRKKSTLSLYRSSAGSPAVLVASFKSPRRKVRFTDKTASSGTYTYWSVLTVKSKKLTSRAVTVTVIPGGSQPEIPAGPGLDVTLKAGQSECPAGSREQVLNDINSIRSSYGLRQLTFETRVNLAARAHAIWMADTGQMVHDGWFDRLIQTGWWGSHASQNIARYISAENVVAAWMTSEGHRNNILDSRDIHIGIGCVISSSGVIYWAVSQTAP